MTATTTMTVRITIRKITKYSSTTSKNLRSAFSMNGSGRATGPVTWD